MWLQRLTNYILNNKWKAALLTFLITYIPIVGLISIVIAGFVTLCLGVLEGAIFTIAATLPYALIFASSTQNAIPVIVWATVFLSVIGNILTWVFAIMLRRHCKWSFIVQVAALLGVLAISVVHLIFPQVSDWWAAQMQLFYNQSAAMAGWGTPGVPGQALALGDAQIEAINVAKKFATGIVTAFILFTAVVQVMVARWWQVAIVNHSRLGKEFQLIHLSRLAGTLFIISIIFYYLENSVVLDILPVLCLLFSAAGLSLVHYLGGLMGPQKSRYWLSAVYVPLMFSLIILAMLPLFSALNMNLPIVLAVLILSASVFIFASLGLFDVWFNVRKKVRKV